MGFGYIDSLFLILAVVALFAICDELKKIRKHLTGDDAE